MAFYFARTKSASDHPVAGATRWQFLDPLIVALPVAVLVTVVVSCLTRPPGKDHPDKCFEGIEKKRRSHAQKVGIVGRHRPDGACRSR